MCSTGTCTTGGMEAELQKFAFDHALVRGRVFVDGRGIPWNTPSCMGRVSSRGDWRSAWNGMEVRCKSRRLVAADQARSTRTTRPHVHRRHQFNRVSFDAVLMNGDGGSAARAWGRAAVAGRGHGSSCFETFSVGEGGLSLGGCVNRMRGLLGGRRRGRSGAPICALVKFGCVWVCVT